MENVHEDWARAVEKARGPARKEEHSCSEEELFVSTQGWYVAGALVREVPWFPSFLGPGLTGKTRHRARWEMPP